MAALLKERARRPLIPADIGIASPTFKHVEGVDYYVCEIREPWCRDGYQIYSILLTEKEMLNMTASWLSSLNERNRP